MKKLRVFKNGTYFLSDSSGQVKMSISYGDDKGVEVEATGENIKDVRKGKVKRVLSRVRKN